MRTQKMIIEIPADWDIHNPIRNCPLTEHGCGEFGACTGNNCPIANGKMVMTLEAYQKANPKRPTGNQVQEIYIVEPKI